MISLCVFSKNRAMQLDAFLKSLVNAPYITDVQVLYNFSDDKFKQAYDILKTEHPNIKFDVDNDIPLQVINFVQNAQEFFLLATDDSLFYRPATLTQDKIDWVFKEKGALALNLRMGLNIKWQNHWKSEPSAPIIVEDTYQDIILWDAAQYHKDTDVGRVWQNDASIMPRDMYLKHLLSETDWKQSIRSLDNLANSGRVFNPCKMAAFDTSVYLNIPVNLVHPLADGTLYADNWGKFHKYDVHFLNGQFLNGQRVDWERFETQDLDCGRREMIFYVFS